MCLFALKLERALPNSYLVLGTRPTRASTQTSVGITPTSKLAIQTQTHSQETERPQHYPHLKTLSQQTVAV